MWLWCGYAIYDFRNLWLLLCLLSILLYSFMVGYPFSFLCTISCLWGQIRRLTMSTLDCGIFMGFYPWMHGCGVLFSIVGKLFLWFPFMVCSLYIKLWFIIEVITLKAQLFLRGALILIFMHFCVCILSSDVKIGFWPYND